MMAAQPPQPQLQVTLDQLFAAQDSSIEDIDEMMRNVHGPGWEARFEFVKILFALDGGIFGGILAFSDAIFSNATPAGVVLILFALGGLIISIGCALAVVWLRISIAGFRARYFNQRQQIRTECQNVDLTRADAYEQITEIFRQYVDSTVGPMGSSDSKSQKAAVAAGISFIVALLLLLIAMYVQYAGSSEVMPAVLSTPHPHLG